MRNDAWSLQTGEKRNDAWSLRGGAFGCGLFGFWGADSMQ